MQQEYYTYDIKRSSFYKINNYFNFGEKDIDALNKMKLTNPKDLLVSLNSLNGLTVDMIDRINPKIQYFLVKSDQRRKYELSTMGDGTGNYKKGVLLKNEEYENSKQETYEDGYESAFIYTREELKQIIRKMEKLEYGVENLDDTTKAYVLYDRLVRSVEYEYGDGDRSSGKIRSLRSLISTRGVCACYAEIYQQLLLRNGITCYYESGEALDAKTGKSYGGHAWNIVMLDGLPRAVDVTWGAGYYHAGQKGSGVYQFFGQNYDDFIKTHKANPPIFKCLYKIDDDKKKKAINFTGLRSEYNKNLDTYVGTREDGSSYYIACLLQKLVRDHVMNKDVMVYGYLYIPMKAGKMIKDEAQIFWTTENLNGMINHIDITKDKKLDAKESSYAKKNKEKKEFFKSYLFSKENIEKANKRGSAFLGGISCSSGKFKIVCPDRYVESDFFRKSSMKTIDEHIIYDNGTILMDDGIEVKNFIWLDVDEKGNLNRKTLYSETDLLKLPNSVLSRYMRPERIDGFIENNGGYMGEIIQNGGISFNRTILEWATNNANIKLKNGLDNYNSLLR